MINACKQFSLIDELEMVPKSAVHLLTQYARSRITIQFIGMYKCTYTVMLTRVIPSIRQEAAEQIRLLALQQRIVADSVVERQLSCSRNIFGEECARRTLILQQFRQLLVQIRRANRSNRIFRIHIGNGIGRFPLKLHPRRVTHHKVEAAVLEHVGEFELPVEEPLLLGDFLHQAKPLRRFPVTSAQLIEIHSMVVHVITLMAVIHSIHKRGLTIVHRHQRESLFLWDLAGEDQRHFREVLRPRGKQVRLVDGPEPQRTPVVHGEFQTSVFAGILGLFRMVGNAKHLVLLTDGEVVATEVFIFDAKRPLSKLLLVFQSLRSLLGSVRVKTVDNQIILSRLFQLLARFNLAAP